MDTTWELDRSSIPKELTLLLSLLRTDPEPDLFAKYRDELSGMNWDVFLQLAFHHRVYPALHTNLHRRQIAWIPLQVKLQLQQQYQRNTFEMLHLTSEMEFVSRVLSEVSIRSLMLKGPVLAADLYGDLSLRTCGDLDILVPMQDLEKTEELLRKLGYVKDEYIQTVLNDWKWRHHHVTFFHFQKRIKIEVHWRLGPGPGKEPGFESLWERKRTSSITPNPVYYLGREDLFLFLVSHGARHGWSRLRWLTDIDQLARQEALQPVKLIPLLKQNRHLHLASQALVLSSQLLGTPLSGPLEGVAAGHRGKSLAQEALFYLREMINLHSEPLPEPVSRYHKRHLFSLMSLHHKVLFIMNFFYPYPEDAETLKLPKSVHFLYFPLRPLLWAWRKTKKLAVSQGGTS
ncbi:nucleotidyltransferase domain-containing protein [Paenibacillus rigui]|uniref:Renal dipeptidase n=1 Tax=Paenibacillus rigui TaxID=554312 RepID=A0A229UPB8_9BACL|nr:nucleotidyltransferase family protein [Paenibacillus rigui]OXM85214.1 Renal dipeptidase [Paenibacillus rigui]